MDIMKQTKILRSNTIDKFNTNQDIANLCIEYIKKYVIPNDFDLIIEPNAGNGAFIAGCKSLTYKQHFYDIEIENEEIIRHNFLQYDIYATGLYGTENKVHIIGKPPFGRQSSVAKKYIKKSCEFADSISFILPKKSFKQNSKLLKKFPLNFHCVFEIDLPDNSFNIDGIPYNIPCIFQIWMKRSYNREEIEQIESNLSQIF